MNDEIRAVRVNGREREIRSVALADALAELGVDCARRHVAVALNGDVVPRDSWPSTRLAARDDIEVIGAMQGG
jgi:sulfur carrier protein